MMKGRDTPDKEIKEVGNENLDSKVNAAIPAGGIKAVVSIRMDRRTLEALDEYAREINEKMSTVARGLIVEGLERAGTGMTSDELHELTRLRMKEELSQPGKTIKKEARKGAIRELQSARQDLSYWMGRPAEERVAAVDFLRKQHYGNTARLQRAARVVQRA
jgi:hypothetical protein